MTIYPRSNDLHGYDAYWPQDNEYPELKATLTAQTSTGRYHILALGPIANINPHTHDCGKPTPTAPNLTLAQVMTSIIIRKPDGSTIQPITKISTPDTNHLWIHGHDANVLTIAGRLIDYRLNTLFRNIEEGAYIRLSPTPEPNESLIEMPNATTPLLMHETEDATEYKHTGRYIGYNGAAEIYVPNRCPKHYRLISPQYLCEGCYSTLPANNTTGDYHIEVWGTLAHVDPFKHTMDAEFYTEGTPHLTIAQLILKLILTTEYSKIGCPFASISTPEEGLWLVHGNRPDLMAMAATELEAALSYFLRKVCDNDMHINIGVSQNVFVSSPRPTLDNTTPKLEVQSNQPALPYEAIQLIAAFDSDRDDTAWELALDCVETQYEMYNIQATHNNLRNPYEALLYERYSGVAGPNPRAFRLHIIWTQKWHRTQICTPSFLSDWY
jgi:hypothetical protein